MKMCRLAQFWCAGKVAFIGTIKQFEEYELFFCSFRIIFRAIFFQFQFREWCFNENIYIIRCVPIFREFIFVFKTGIHFNCLNCMIRANKKEKKERKASEIWSNLFKTFSTTEHRFIHQMHIGVSPKALCIESTQINIMHVPNVAHFSHIWHRKCTDTEMRQKIIIVYTKNAAGKISDPKRGDKKNWSAETDRHKRFPRLSRPNQNKKEKRKDKIEQKKTQPLLLKEWMRDDDCVSLRLKYQH